MMVSLRTRLLVSVIVGTALLLMVFSVVLYWATRRTLFRQFDRSLLATAEMLSAVVEREGMETDGDVENDPNVSSATKLDFELDVHRTAEFRTADGGGYYQFWDAEGATIVRSPSLSKADLPRLGASESAAYGDCVLPSGRPGRAIDLRFVPRRDPDDRHPDDALGPSRLTLVLARDAAAIYHHLKFLRWLLGGTSLGILALSAGVGLAVTRTGLGPVHGLAAEIAAVREDTLGQGVTSQRYPAELLPICDRLNEVMSRLDASFQRERQFNTDVAHELRTPLAGIRSTIEVCLTRPRETRGYEEALRTCLRIAKTMDRLVGTLLTLSKLDAGQIALPNEPVGLHALIDEYWVSFADGAHDRRLVFENQVPNDFVCTSDRDHLGMIVSNVLANAVEYSDEGGRIWVEAEREDETTVLRIANTGCQLSTNETDRVFDLFWRAEASRTDTGSHCGIGLTVVRKVAAALGVTVEATVKPDGVFSLHLSFPKQPSLPGAPDSPYG